jgi:hypothetical protein
LYVTTYQKAMNKYLYLPYLSHHPQHVFKGIIKGELIRYTKTNTYKEDYLAIAKSFRNRLVARGYPNRLFTQCFKEIDHSNRNVICQKPNYLKSMSIQVSLSLLSSLNYIHPNR